MSLRDDLFRVPVLVLKGGQLTSRAQPLAQVCFVQAKNYAPRPGHVPTLRGQGCGMFLASGVNVFFASAKRLRHRWLYQTTPFINERVATEDKCSSSHLLSPSSLVGHDSFTPPFTARFLKRAPVTRDVI